MTQQKAKTWTLDNFSKAMEIAVGQHCDARFLRASKEKILFNGFWRDGDKQNVCLWLDKATWHDAKTGEGGGCKEFAKIAFNMSLREFMERFGREEIKVLRNLTQKSPANSCEKPVQEIWAYLNVKDSNRADRAGEWLSENRGFPFPRRHIGSGFANLYEGDEHLFGDQHQQFLKYRLSLGPQIIVPIRSTNSENVKNLFIRAISEVPKEEKSRLLANYGGWREPSGSPRAFGFPHLIPEFPNIVLCEGMSDYFAAECLLEENDCFLPIGAPNADALVKWSKELVDMKYKGTVHIIYHIDTHKDGTLSSKEIGPAKAIKAAQILLSAGITFKIFSWPFYLKHITNHAYLVHDLADSLRQRFLRQECNFDHLKEIFRLSLNK